jgi:hypothetical protein
MQPSKTDLDVAMAQLSMLEFFPTDGITRGAIQILLAKICPSREALDWLVDQMVNRVGKWHGPTELRAVLCTRYRPADGIELDSALPGFAPQDAEMRYLEEHEQRKQLGAGVAGLLPEGTRDGALDAALRDLQDASERRSLNQKNQNRAKCS